MLLSRLASRPLTSYLTSSFIARTTAPLQTSSAKRAMHIQSIPMWVGSSNNYAYLVSDDATKEAVIIDPANPKEVLPILKEAASSLKLTKLMNTHHHWDHAGGNEEILKTYPLPVIGGKDCAKVTETPKHNSTFKIGDNIEVKALHTPCHTQDSICWFMTDTKTNEKVVFTGDTLFIGGCGRFFEGTAEEMNTALNKVLASLPDETKVYPGHEYTKANVKFLVTVEGENSDVKRLQKFADENKETQGKFTIGDEKKYNAFMRVGAEQIKKATGEQGPVEVMAKLREMKNSM